jgi:peptidoglycan/LPS O-acetylase OafA/YrhL
MLLKTVPFRYHEFALRRTTRVFGPYLAALALALAGNFWLARGIRPDFSDVFNLTWPVPINRAAVWQHLAFLGEYDTRPFNLAFWSLVHEMRISLIFPLLLLIVRGKSAAWSCFVAVLLLAVGSLLKANIPRPNNLGESLHYAGLFVVGTYISEHQRSLASWFRSRGITVQRLFFGGALALFCYGRFATHLLPYGYGEFQDIPLGLAAAALMVVAFSSAPVSAFLVSKPIDWLGTRSYSLYLVHGTVLYALVDLLNLSRPTALLLPLYVVIALLATRYFYLAIELPLVLLSRKFTPRTGTPRVTESETDSSKTLVRRKV